MYEQLGRPHVLVEGPREEVEGEGAGVVPGGVEQRERVDGVGAHAVGLPLDHRAGGGAHGDDLVAGEARDLADREGAAPVALGEDEGPQLLRWDRTCVE